MKYVGTVSFSGLVTGGIMLAAFALAVSVLSQSALAFAAATVCSLESRSLLTEPPATTAPAVFQGGFWGDVPSTGKRQANLLSESAFVSAKPLWFTATFGGDESARRVIVLDESQGPGKGYDTLYVDANGDRRLTAEESVRGRRGVRRDKRAYTEFGPVAISLLSGSQTTTQHFLFRLFTDERTPALQVANTNYMAGTARFGSEDYRVVVIDFNANGLFNDQDVSLSDDDEGDGLLIDLNRDGTFDISADEEGALEGLSPGEFLPMGKYVLVGGRYYRISLPPDGIQLTVDDSPVPTGTLKTKAHKFTLFLHSPEEGPLMVSASEGSALVPSGQYSLVLWFWQASDKAGQGWRFMGFSEASPIPITVVEGRTTEVKIGPPFIPKLVPEVKGKEATFNLQIAGQAGETYFLVEPVDRSGRRIKSASKPPAPKLKLTDSKGKPLALLNFHYG